MPKNCYLTDAGLKKVEEALERLIQEEEIIPEEKECKLLKKNGKPFPENVNYSQLAKFANLASETITRILRVTDGVTENSLARLFFKLEIIYVENEVTDFHNKYYKYEIPQEQIDPPEPNNNEPSVKIIVAQNGIPFIVRRNT
jgi:hypothetical protein